MHIKKGSQDIEQHDNHLKIVEHISILRKIWIIFESGQSHPKLTNTQTH